MWKIFNKFLFICLSLQGRRDEHYIHAILSHIIWVHLFQGVRSNGGFLAWRTGVGNATHKWHLILLFNKKPTVIQFVKLYQSSVFTWEWRLTTCAFYSDFRMFSTLCLLVQVTLRSSLIKNWSKFRFWFWGTDSRSQFIFSIEFRNTRLRIHSVKISHAWILFLRLW